MTADDKPVYFFGDAHLTTLRTPDEIERGDRVARFLAHVRDHASALYVLGDLFDFWFEYRHAVPKGHFQVFRRLYELREAGVPTIFLAGNHDYWCLPFLEKEFGIETHRDPFALTLQGRRIWLAHGDGLVREDWAYRLLRRVLRNPLAIGAYRLIHPDLGVLLAHRSSGTSRQFTQQRHLTFDSYRDEVVKPKFAEGYDAVILGHVHIPTHERIGGKDFIFVGDWITRCTYVRLARGVFEQLAWRS